MTDDRANEGSRPAANQPVDPRDASAPTAGTGEAASDDFAARNVVMSNALPPDASPAAGAVIADTDPVLEPTTDEERLERTE
jgi:hypothetical protein